MDGLGSKIAKGINVTDKDIIEKSISKSYTPKELFQKIFKNVKALLHISKKSKVAHKLKEGKCRLLVNIEKVKSEFLLLSKTQLAQLLELSLICLTS